MKNKIIYSSMIVGAIWATNALRLETAQAEDAKPTCKKADVVEQVNKGCKFLEDKGEKGFDDVKAIKFCGENYAWIQDEKTLLMHPIKPALKGKSLPQKGPKGGPLLEDVSSMAKEKEEGAWVEYKWPLISDPEKSEPKMSFAKKCKTKEMWIVGAGAWKKEYVDADK